MAHKNDSIPAIKGMNKDMTCRGHQFEIGKTYTIDGPVKACNSGFHACPADDDTPPHAVFEYYAPGVSRYFDVTASGVTDREGNKIASASITIGVEITMGQLMRRVAEWCVKKSKGAASNSGYGGAASNSGDYGAAFSHAYDSKVMCEGEGQALYCTEFADDGSIASVACGITGKKGIKAGRWYHAKNGKLVEYKN